MTSLTDESAFRAFMLTGNNPSRLLDGLELDFDTATESELRAGLDFLVETWVKGDKNHKARNPEINGVAATFERGEGGTPHAHILICCKNPIKIKALKKRFPGFHIDVLRGTADEAKDYIFKRNRHSAKATTSLCPAVEWGEHFCSNGAGGGEKIYDVAERYIRQGMTPNQLILAEPRFARFERMVQALYSAHIQASIPAYREVFFEWHMGPSGSGKTHVYLELCEKYGMENVYLVSGTSKHPWDGYSETMSKVIIDEIRGQTFASAAELLGICDGYKIALNARFRDKLANWDELHATTIVSPEKLWEQVRGSGDERDTVEQLLRRLNVITYHYVDESYAGDARYKRISVAAKDYKGAESLEKMAEEARRISAMKAKRGILQAGDDGEPSSERE